MESLIIERVSPETGYASTLMQADGQLYYKNIWIATHFWHWIKITIRTFNSGLQALD